jgi:hypothetical protein
LKKRTRTEVNEMILTFAEGLNFLCHHELGPEIQDADSNLRYRRIWDRLRRNFVSEGLPISNPSSMFLWINANSIRHYSRTRSRNKTFRNRNRDFERLIDH